MILIIPNLITVLVDPSMNIDRYDQMTLAIEEDFRTENASIVDGVLTYETPIQATFGDLFTLYLGPQDLDRRTFNFVFEDTGVIFYISDIEFDQISYSDLNLLNHDFSSTDAEDLRVLDIALKTYIEQQPSITFVDITVQYIFSLVDYLFIVFLMSMMMLIFVTHVQFPFKLRFKLSVYLTTIWVFAELVLTLFHAEALDFLSILFVYVYHILAYRSVKVIKKGAI